MNTHLTSYLNHFLDKENNPQFAIMIDGAWGSGKTHFITKYMSKKENLEFINITLYGVDKFSDIEAQVFQQVHPILASKLAVLSANFFTKTLTALTRFDFNDDKRDDINLSLNLGDIKLKDFLEKIHKKIYIFDDFERCSIPTELLLGYINQITEHQGSKVIIIANEQEIHSKEANKNQEKHNAYLRMKEKVIGKTFSVEPDVAEACQIFIEEIKEKEIKNRLISHKQSILDIFKSFDQKNLRTLRKIINEFKLIFSLLPEFSKESESFVSHILETLIILTCEIQKGRLKASEISKIKKAYDNLAFKTLKKSKDNNLSKIESIANDYKQLTKTVPSLELWENFFTSGGFNKPVLREEIESSTFFFKETTHNWVKLWHFSDLENEDFEEVLKQVSHSFFEEKNLHHPGVIKHICGIFLRLKKNNLIDMTPIEIQEKVESVIDVLHSSNQLDFINDDEVTFYSRSFKGLGYMESGANEFKEISKKLEDINTEKRKKTIKNKIKKSMTLLKENTYHFCKEFDYRYNSKNKFYENACLHYIDVQTFYEILLSIPNKDLKLISFMFDQRSEMVDSHPQLKEELEWFKRLKNLIIEGIDKQKQIKRWLLNLLHTHSINKVIESMQD